MDNGHDPKRLRPALLLISAAVAVGVGVSAGLTTMRDKGINFRPLREWMSPEKTAVVATPTAPTRVTWERSVGILTFKQPVAVVSVSRRADTITYTTGPLPEMHHGVTIEFPASL